MSRFRHEDGVDSQNYVEASSDPIDDDEEDCSSLTSSASSDTFHVFTDVSVSMSVPPNQDVDGERQRLRSERQKLEQERRRLREERLKLEKERREERQKLAEERKKLEEERRRLRMSDEDFHDHLVEKDAESVDIDDFHKADSVDESPPKAVVKDNTNGEVPDVLEEERQKLEEERQKLEEERRKLQGAAEKKKVAKVEAAVRVKVVKAKAKKVTPIAAPAQPAAAKPRPQIGELNDSVDSLIGIDGSSSDSGEETKSLLSSGHSRRSRKLGSGSSGHKRQNNRSPVATGAARAGRGVDHDGDKRRSRSYDDDRDRNPTKPGLERHTAHVLEREKSPRVVRRSVRQRDEARKANSDATADKKPPAVPKDVELDANGSLHVEDLQEENRKADLEQAKEAKEREEAKRKEILAMARKKLQEERKQRQEMIRQRIAAEEAEAKRKKKEDEAKKQTSKNKPDDNTEKARAERAYGWYTKLAMPSNFEFKKKVTLIASIDITEEDVDLLPWTASGSMVNVAKLNAILYSRR